MANEIIALEKNGNTQTFAFLYAIPPEQRIEIGGVGTTGQYPVMSPTLGIDTVLLLVLTQAEKDALDAGEAVIRNKSFAIPPGSTDAQVLGWAQQVYANETAPALAEYQERYQYIGRRFDKE